MQILAQYPINANHVNPFIGRPVGAILPDGDLAYGVLDRLHDEHVVLKPIDGVSTAAVQSWKKQMKNHPVVKAAMKKVKTKAWGYGGAYPYGWGYGNFGWGAGWWWIWPLFFILALVAWPFWW